KYISFQADFKIPFISPNAVNTLEDNFKWLAQTLNRPVVQAPPAPTGNTPQGNRPLTDEQKQQMALTEQALAATAQVMKHSYDLDVSNVNGGAIREADQPAQQSRAERWSPAPQKNWGIFDDNDPVDYS